MKLERKEIQEVRSSVTWLSAGGGGALFNWDSEKWM